MDNNSEKEILTGYVDHFIFKSEANGFCVFMIISDGDEVQCIGTCHELGVGDSVEMEGEYFFDPNYGKEFKAKKITIVPPADEESMERYLGSGAVKGIGAALAARIVKAFGADTFRIIEEEPERLAEIKGISKSKAMDIAVQLEEKRDLRDVMVYLAGFKISQNMSVKIYEEYGTDIYAIMKENPYRLADDIKGIGFQTADKIALDMGMSTDSEFRIRSGILYVLSETRNDGNTYLPLEDLTELSASLLGVQRQLIEREIENLRMERRMITEDNNAYLPSMYNAEKDCARLLAERSGRLSVGNATDDEIRSQLLQIARREKMEADDLQLDAAARAVRNGVFILSGGPGTGKTTTINLIIRYLTSQGMDILLAAPTGRAAKRMTETTGYEAKTIHRLLGVGGNPENTAPESYFGKDQDDPLEADYVIIDEMSMVDLQLFHALLRAVVPGTGLILVGDVDQLPSVGPGQVLRDLIESGRFPCVILERIFRQAMDSDIIVNAHEINKGNHVRLDTKSKDFLFLERKDEKEIKGIIVWMLRDKLPGYCNASVRDIQVLTPMRMGALGCIEMNRYLQEILNPAKRGTGEHIYGDTVFREGDKVMQTRNNYKLEWNIYGKYGIKIDSGEGIFNGDTGIIRQIRENEKYMEIEFDDGRVVEYPFSGLEELELAYAMTIHKSQGSEYPAVLIPILDPPRMLRYRNLLYTGITRARGCVVLIGSSKTINEMTDTVSPTRRYTSLRRRIEEI